MSAANTKAQATFAADFPAATDVQWRGLVDKILKGADFDKRLVSKTADGLAIRPLYTAENAGTVLSAAAAGRTDLGDGSAWEIRQIVAEHDAKKANAIVLEELSGGASAISLMMAAPGWFGLDYSAEALATALEGVLLDVCPIHLIAGEYTPDAAGSLIAHWRKHGIADGQAKGGFGYDPIGNLALTGALYQPLDKALGVAADLVALAKPMKGVTALAANGHIWHNAGASEAQELAFVLLTVVAYLRAAETRGIAPAEALPKIAVQLAVDADQFLGIAKLRAIRVLLARVAEACGASAGYLPPIEAGTSWRMMTRRDPWVNMLRTTIATSAAAMGGADAITVLPFTWGMGKPDAFARRIARNTQIVLQEESSLGRVADPAGGSWYVESLTTDLAGAAWKVFQDIEGKGGLGAALASNYVHGLIAAMVTARNKALSTGKQELTGTSAFPKLGGDGVTVEAWPTEKLSADLKGARVKPVGMARLAEPFEALRDAADSAKVPARVFLATLGPLAAHAARATWIRNFCAAGGIDCAGGDPLHNSADAGKAFADSGASVAVIASSDDVYAELGEATASALKSAGAKAVYVAGRQKDEAALRAAGVDGFIFAGADMIATLKELHGKIGI